MLQVYNPTLYRAIQVLLALTINFINFPQHSIADDAKARLDKSIEERNTKLKEAELNLLKGFDAAIVDLATTGDTDTLKKLIEQKEAFQKEFKRPQAKQISEQFESYINTRKELNQKLTLEYQAAIAHFAKKLLLAETTSIDKDYRAFIESEKVQLSALSSRPSLAESPALQKSKLTREQIEDFEAKLAAEIDNINEQVTDARATAMSAELPEKMNKLLKNRTWTFTAEIKDIRPHYNDYYDLKIEPPFELAGFKSNWRFVSHVKIKLKKSDALKISPGEFIVVSGTPVFAKNHSGDDGVLSCNYETRGIERYFEIGIAGFKFDIRKSVPHQTDGDNIEK